MLLPEVYRFSEDEREVAAIQADMEEPEEMLSISSRRQGAVAAMRSSAGAEDSDASGSVTMGVGGQVWIVGHSFIFWAEHHPFARRASEQLGGRTVRWLSIRGLRWAGFVELVLGQEQVWGRPEWLVVHLGGNDLGQLKGIDLIWKIKGDMRRISELWPGVRLAWSDTVPRQRRRGARDIKAIDKARKSVNWAVSRFMVDLRGVAVLHPRLVVQDKEYFFKDGVHLSSKGTLLEVLLEDIFLALV